MKVLKIVTTKIGDKKVEIALSKDDEKYLLQYAFNDLLEKGAISVVKERNDYLMKMEVGGNA